MGFLAKLIERIMPPKDQIFFKLFEESMEISIKSAILLEDIYKNGLTEDKTNQAGKLRLESRNITHDLLEKLGATFVTPLDREDIQSIAFFITKITKRIIHTIKNTAVYNLSEFTPDLQEQASQLVYVIKELSLGLKHLKQNNLKELNNIIDRIKELEGQIEFSARGSLGELFANEKDMLKILKLQRLYRDLETIGETCYNLADRILNIVLKNN